MKQYLCIGESISTARNIAMGLIEESREKVKEIKIDCIHTAANVYYYLPQYKIIADDLADKPKFDEVHVIGSLRAQRVEEMKKELESRTKKANSIHIVPV